MIRVYSPRDKQALLRLLRLNTPKYFHPEEENDFASYLDKEVEQYFVVEENSELVAAGGINYFFDECEARLSWDMVHPAWQGKGMGAKLTHYRISQIRQRAAVEVIEVRTTQLVYRFYEKMGFALERTEKNFWASGFDLYQMKLPLTPILPPLQP